MELLIRNGRVWWAGAWQEADVLVREGRVAAVGRGLASPAARVVNAAGCAVVPGFCDLHVHLRQPGFEEKETVATGTAAAAAGGFTTVCAMPNLSPVPSDLHSLEPQLEAIRAEGAVRVLPYGALTVDEKGGCPADIAVLAAFVAGFSDDGRGVQEDAMMRRVMEAAAAEGSLVAAHCEVEALIPTGAVCVQEGSAFAREKGFAGVSSQSEWKEVERDIALAEETGCRLHICHASTKETFELVRAAKRKGLPVTCEVTPHNLLLCEDDVQDHGRFKMNPPLRTPADRDAALAALLDGTADAIATDHAPHTAAEKDMPFEMALNGVVGLETAFPVLYTRLVRPGIMALEKLVALLTEGPRRVLGEAPGVIEPGSVADLTVLDLERERSVDPHAFKSKGRATPFAGWALRGWPVLTLAEGRLAYMGAHGAGSEP